MWDPARLVKRSVAMGTPMIVATINYRLNMFGFAGSSDIIHAQPDVQQKGCNFGLGDQRIAILWVRQNIGAFGGDATRITIGGQSAGGSSSHAHVLEAIRGKGEPLVQRGIIQSGAVGVLGPIPMAVADARWEAFCQHLGAPTGDASSRIAFMATIAPSEILRATGQLGSIVCPLVVDDLTISQKPNGRWRIHFADNEAISPSDTPTQDAGVISALIGDTDVEAVIHLGEVGKIQSFPHLEELLADQVTSTEFMDKVYQAYGLQPDVPVSDLRKRVLQLLTDIQFGYPVQCARQELMGWEKSRDKDSGSTARPTAVHSYRMSVGNPFPGPRYGLAQHCVDLIYIYDCIAEALRVADEALPANVETNAGLVERIQEDWVRFITAPSVSSQAGCATVYGSDRTVSLVHMETNQAWTERLRRFHLLETYWASAQQLIKALAGSGHVF
ncbi:alpha/beta-hydrolase [Aspergillus sclerotioniger CBS 115572]|uniref:Carboxylic ester hydrolase n=1 Tax=Aspergillus sclerotioniger CBS 115572 TaxID=1450535 RepID=A0A317X252_9EURO|nr:alpha/beta-hydrolase [Aspergillus sclerotioniger CBS 115572]PWY91682.1 alpha/beta-hydrolase [Aspergillus sclerotioniger CBS 115572]